MADFGSFYFFGRGVANALLLGIEAIISPSLAFLSHGSLYLPFCPKICYLKQHSLGYFFPVSVPTQQKNLEWQVLLKESLEVARIELAPLSDKSRFC